MSRRVFTVIFCCIESHHELRRPGKVTLRRIKTVILILSPATSTLFDEVVSGCLILSYQHVCISANYTDSWTEQKDLRNKDSVCYPASELILLTFIKQVFWAWDSPPPRSELHRVEICFLHRGARDSYPSTYWSVWRWTLGGAHCIWAELRALNFFHS